MPDYNNTLNFNYEKYNKFDIISIEKFNKKQFEIIKRKLRELKYIQKLLESNFFIVEMTLIKLEN